MTDEKVYRPEVIDDIPFPGQEDSSIEESSGNTKQVYTAERVIDKSFPTKRPAVELISSALNTQSRRILGEFKFTQTGALQIGEYVSGATGDVRISPSGITARNSSGNTTFSLDGETGNATFAGTVQAGAIIAGQVTVGNNNVIIDGENKRIIINDGSNDRVLLGYAENLF